MRRSERSELDAIRILAEQLQEGFALYDSDDRLLLRYDGPGNLASRDGSMPNVVIYYEHLETQDWELFDWGSEDLIVNDWTKSRIAR